ncbi:UxaA family hydrolase [Virgibacillus ndiopensis]|uniref:UxaA family hydrolase n=1 Tax=Virgibacillus ndiopensis TaxID=2004408 RepID=UPI000C0792F0|nr:UxaA family hydrolase [Virgibacillus ndiopensis]
MHKFLIHYKGDHVGVAVEDIEKNEKVLGVHMDDDSIIEVVAKEAVPLGHKISVAELPPNQPVIEYMVQIGSAPNGLSVGDYVHTHNIKTSRW